MGKPETVELLKAQAKLLLRRERELFELRQAQERNEAWLHAFNTLSAGSGSTDVSRLSKAWTELMVRELKFQVAAVFQQADGGSEYRLEHGQSHSPLRPTLPGEGEIEPHAGIHPAEQLPTVLRPLTLVHCLWQAFPVQRNRLILVAGFTGAVSIGRPMVEADLQAFCMLADHFAALVRNAVLIDELEGEQLGLRVLNTQLVDSNRQLQRNLIELTQTREHLLQAEKLGVTGRLAGAVAHEVNNPLTLILWGLDFWREHIERGQAFVEAARQACPEAFGVQTEQAQTRLAEAERISGEASTAAQRLKDLVAGFVRLATPSRELGAVESVDLADVVRTSVGVEIARGTEVLVNRAEVDLAVRTLAGALQGAAPLSAVRAWTEGVDGPSLVLAHPTLLLVEAERQRFFDPRIETDSEGTMRLNLALAEAYQWLLAVGAEVTLTDTRPGLSIRVRFRR